jgi:hypothetical protein
LSRAGQRVDPIRFIVVEVWCHTSSPSSVLDVVWSGCA